MSLDETLSRAANTGAQVLLQRSEDDLDVRMYGRGSAQVISYTVFLCCKTGAITQAIEQALVDIQHFCKPRQMWS